MMNDNQVQDLLLKLIEDVAIIKSKLDTLDELKMDNKSINTRVDKIEAQLAKCDKQIEILENRCNAIEKNLHDSATESRKNSTTIFISVSMAILSTVLNILF